MAEQPDPPLRFELSQKFYFEAAHTLHREVDTAGSRRIHGHTYHVEVSVAGAPAAGSGMLVDLAIVRQAIAQLRELLDHHLLDDVAGLGPATLENLCLFIRTHLLEHLPGLCAVSVERGASGDRCTLRW